MLLAVIRHTVGNDHDLCKEIQDDNSITSREFGVLFKVHHTIFFIALKRNISPTTKYFAGCLMH